MPIAVGQKLGGYEIQGLLGKGGMGEVYRSRDMKLKRDVAIKVLPDEFSRDAERVSRFQREAELLASLNHPHIAAIYELGEIGELRFLVLELVEGETLADRIARGAVPTKEALEIARQMAEALEAAHERGIVHRDLKPANIKITSEGNVKVLDFGLAKLREAGKAGTDPSVSPTTMLATMPGVILGTAAYMSPEQARGKEADRTSDMWAFGCILYEMLTARAVFEGESIGEILAAVFKTEPDWHRLPAETPEGIRRLLRRCLQKERKLRLHDLADARIEIDEAGSGPDTDSRADPSVSRRRERTAWISALALVALIAALAVFLGSSQPPPGSEMRLELTTPPATDPMSLAISPDGRKIVFEAITEKQPRLWLRSLDSVRAEPLAGTDGALIPFWSPDSRSVGFFAEGKLKRIDINGGSVQTLASAPRGEGGAWNRDGVILFATLGNPLRRVSALGGEPVTLPRIEAEQGTRHAPEFLPDQHHFLYYVRGPAETRGIYVSQLEGTQSRRLLDADTGAAYSTSGHLLFIRQGTLFAQNFDPVRLELNGYPFPIAKQVSLRTPGRPISVSAAGVVAYRSGPIGVQRQFVWFDRSGQEMGRAGDPGAGGLSSPSLSPDGRYVAGYRGGGENANPDIWLLELGRGVFSRFTSDPADDVSPVWSPDGIHIAFSSLRNGIMDLYQSSTTGSGKTDLLLATPQPKTATDWSSDGGFLLYQSLDPKTSIDLWALPLNGKGNPFPVSQTKFDEVSGQFSPDVKWIAFQSDDSGRPEIYVQPFPGPGGKIQISTSGGTQPRWRRDGRELFYISLDGRLIATSMRFDGPTPEVGVPIPLFSPPLGGAVQHADYRHQYMVAPDGKRFLVAAVTEAADTPPITVILNFRAKP